MAAIYLMCPVPLLCLGEGEDRDKHWKTEPQWRTIEGEEEGKQSYLETYWRTTNLANHLEAHVMMGMATDKEVEDLCYALQDNDYEWL